MTEEVDRVLRWPAWTRTDDDVRVLKARRVELQTELRSLVEHAERGDRNLTAEEAAEFDRLQDEYDRLGVELPVS